MSLADELAADRRLVLLRAMAEVPGWSMNEMVAKTAVAHFGHRVGSDIVRADLQYLYDHGLVRIEKLQAERGELWLAELTGGGDDVAAGRRVVPGIRPRRPE